jgi:S-layer protein (TIGR01564 family)
LDNLKASSDKAYVVKALDTSSSPLVVLDTMAAATQPLIVVGGPIVNLVAQQTPGGDVAATAGSEAVVKVIGDKILVYGYTAGDTTSAANALIGWLAQNAATIQR